MTEQTPNEVDRSGQKVGMWTEVDSHGGVKVGEYVEGKRQGVWRHYFVEWVGALGGHVRQRRSGWAWTWYRSTGDLRQRWGFPGFREAWFWERWDPNGKLDRPGDL
ncbi:MAG TPA: hypothetical protein VE027_04535 [Acidimicrobiia bacterium]|nr:hypothetical protein [Acidimicrobiia bacterium]